MNKRIIEIISLLIILSLLLSSCFGKVTEDTSEISEEESGIVSEISEEESIEESSEELPPSYSFDKIALSLLVGGEERLAEFLYGSENESSLYGAVEKRLDTIKSVHGISFDALYVSENDDVTTELETRSYGGLETDLVLYGASSFGKHVFYDLYYDLNSLEGLSAVTENASSALSVCGKLFFVTGDVCVSSYDSAYALFFNKPLVKDDLYDVVRSGKWTVDRMYEYAKKAASGKMTFSSENAVFGIVSKSDDAAAFMTSCGESTVLKDTDGKPTRNIGKAENVSFFEKLISVISDPSCSGIAENYGSWKTTHETEKEIFFSGRALFMPYTLSIVKQTEKGYDADVGILPMPKKSEESEYRTPCDLYSLSVIGIPKSNTLHLEQACASLELLGYYGRHDLRNVYISSVCQTLSLDETDREMLSLICESLDFDIGIVYNTTGSGDTSLMRIYAFAATADERFEELVDPLLPSYERGIEEIIRNLSEGAEK